MANKQINEFIEKEAIESSDLLLVQDGATGVYYKTTPSNIDVSLLPDSTEKFTHANMPDVNDLSAHAWEAISKTGSSLTDIEEYSVPNLTVTGTSLDKYTFTKDEENGTVALNLPDSNMPHPIGLATLIRVTNKTGGTIPKGTLCACSDETPGNSSVLLVEPWDGTQPVTRILGVNTDDIPNTDTEGYVTYFGKAKGINTSGTPYGETWVDGDIIFAGSTGGLTKVPPQAPNPKVTVGRVISAHSTAGSIFIKISPSSSLKDDDLVELTDLTDKSGIYYNSVTERFENSTTPAFGDYTAGNYTEFEPTGFQAMAGSAQAWDDMYPSSISSTASGQNAAAYTAYLGNLIALEFVGSGPASKEANITYQLYHTYNEGTDIKPHIHLYIPPGTGTIKFFMDYIWYNASVSEAPVVQTLIGTISIDSDTPNPNRILSFPGLDGTDKKISSILATRLYRNPTDPEDTFNSSVWLMSADVHIRTNTLGSRQEYIK